MEADMAGMACMVFAVAVFVAIGLLGGLVAIASGSWSGNDDSEDGS